jgi:hypothetical protein
MIDLEPLLSLNLAGQTESEQQHPFGDNVELPRPR